MLEGRTHAIPWIKPIAGPISRSSSPGEWWPGFSNGGWGSRLPILSSAKVVLFGPHPLAFSFGCFRDWSIFLSSVLVSYPASGFGTPPRSPPDTAYCTVADGFPFSQVNEWSSIADCRVSIHTALFQPSSSDTGTQECSLYLKSSCFAAAWWVPATQRAFSWSASHTHTHVHTQNFRTTAQKRFFITNLKNTHCCLLCMPALNWVKGFFCFFFFFCGTCGIKWGLFLLGVFESRMRLQIDCTICACFSWFVSSFSFCYDRIWCILYIKIIKDCSIRFF